MIGRDFDVVVKESFNMMSKFRREIEVVNEDFRRAGAGLAEAVVRTIAGADPAELQTLDVPEASRVGLARPMYIACPFHVPDFGPIGGAAASSLRDAAEPTLPPTAGLHLSPTRFTGRTWRGRGDAMAFFQKLKDRLFKSSSKIEEGIDAIIDEAPADAAPAPEPRRLRLRRRRRAAGLVGRLLGQEKGRVLDDAMLESLEELLIQSDMGVETSLKVTAAIAEGRFGRRVGRREIRELLARRDRGDPRAGGAADADLPEAPAGGAGRRASTARARRRRSASSRASSAPRARRW